MHKDFQRWHTLKSDIDTSHPCPLFHEREIWWCSLGANVGVEEDGKNDFFERPVMIVRKFNQEMFWGPPLTSRGKDGEYYAHFFLHEIARTAILSQLRTLSAKRLVRKIGRIGKKCFGDIQRETAMILTQKRASINKNGPLAGASGA